MNSSMKTWICFILLLVVGGMVVAPVSAAPTTWVNVTKYADNDYSKVTAWSNMTYLDMANSFPNVYSNGDIYMQGATFDPNDKYGDAGQAMTIFYGHNGTYVRNLTDAVGGMNEGDELAIIANDGFYMHFGEDDINSPEATQPNLVLTWWDSDMGFVPDFSYGMRLYFYDPNPAATYSVNDSLNFTLREMCDNFDPWYQRWVGDWGGTGSYPNTKGLSVKNVQYLKIYPPHRYDFDPTGDTTGWAYEGGVGASPGLNDPSGTTVDTSKIADDDGNYDWFNTTTIGTYAAQRFVFDVVEPVDPSGYSTGIEKLAVTWDGTSSHDNSSVDQGATVYIWKNGTGYEPLSGDITSDIGEYIIDGNVTVLVKQNVAQSTSGIPPVAKHSRLGTDYVKLVVTHHHANS